MWRIWKLKNKIEELVKLLKDNESEFTAKEKFEAEVKIMDLKLRCENQENNKI